jgi:hypothetical protein
MRNDKEKIKINAKEAKNEIKKSQDKSGRYSLSIQ